MKLVFNRSFLCSMPARLEIPRLNNDSFLTTSMIQSVGNLLRKTDQVQELLVWVLHQGLEDLLVLDGTLNFILEDLDIRMLNIVW